MIARPRQDDAAAGAAAATAVSEVPGGPHGAVTTVSTGKSPQEPLGRGTVALLVVATFGGGIATLVPMAFSLALRLDQLAPGREDLLGYVLGANALSSLITMPVTGIVSDRTRTRWGRRHPFTVAGMVLGLAALPLMVYAPSVPVLALGWMLTSLGFGTAAGSVANFQADRLPPQQRGKVAGLAGMVMQISPVVGVVLASLVTDHVLWVFLLPALVGVAAMTAFVLFVHEEDSRGLTFSEPLSAGRVLRSFGFDPRTAPDFAWNWLGRFVLFLGVSFATTYTTFFYAQRLDVAVPDVAPVLATLSAVSVLSAAAGAVGAGWLSDRLRRRRPFVLAGAVLLACGYVVTALSWSLPTLMAGTLVQSLGIAVFSAANQALVLDVMPHRETQAGRFSAIIAFSQKIPNALGPVAAAPLLAVTAVGGGRNYTALYLAAAACAGVGGLIAACGTRGTR